MAEEHIEVNSERASEITGQNARRKFLKTSGRVAIAAPAAVLLLAAANKSAVAQVAPYLSDIVDDTADAT